MAVVAYASAIPLVGSPPPVADATLAFAALPAQVSLYGGLIDDADPTPTPTFAWQIIENPPNSTARFQDTDNAASTLQNPVVIGINVWENIRIFLVATNQDNAASSEADIYKAPDTAFVTIRVTSASAAIQKPAPSERNWYAPLRTIIEKLEAVIAGGFVLPPAVLQLIGGGYAIFNNNTLHKHSGAHIDFATNGVPGVIYLEQAAAFPNDPKALNSERVAFSAQLGGTITANGFSPGTVEPPVVVVGNKRAHALFYIKEARLFTGFRVYLADGGAAAGTYEFGLYSGNEAAWEAGAPTLMGTTITGSAATDNAPTILVKDFSVNVAADQYVGLCCLQAPSPAGGSATVTVTAIRSV